MWSEHSFRSWSNASSALQLILHRPSKWTRCPGEGEKYIHTYTHHHGGRKQFLSGGGISSHTHNHTHTVRKSGGAKSIEVYWKHTFSLKNWVGNCPPLPSLFLPPCTYTCTWMHIIHTATCTLPQCDITHAVDNYCS